MLQMGIQLEKGEKKDMGEPSISARSTTLFSKAAYIPQVVHKEIMEYEELCRGSSPDGPPLLSLPLVRKSLTEDPPRSQGPMTAHFASCHDEPPPPLLRWQGKSLTEGTSQMPGTNDSTLRQLKPPRPSCMNCAASAA